jgi:tetratricopeptide (TPR) repeat protein
VSRGEPIELSDPFPISAARAGVFAVRWPEQAGLVSLKAQDVLRSGGVTPLEQADALYEDERYEDALSLYAQQGLESSEREVQQEARFKRALCLMHLNRTDEAMQAFQPLVAEPGERWPPQAGVQLWLLLLRQNRYEDADAVYEVLASRFSFQDLATMVPADVRSEILEAYLRAFTSIGNALAFRPEQIRELERAAAVDRFLSYDGQGELMTQVDLSRGYRYLEDYESSLAVLEPIVRSTYHTVPWRHYMRTLRVVGPGRRGAARVRPAAGGHAQPGASQPLRVS